MTASVAVRLLVTHDILNVYVSLRANVALPFAVQILAATLIQVEEFGAHPSNMSIDDIASDCYHSVPLQTT